ncbi:hypothetical protein D3C76_1788340 [compost metagenome]
MHLQVGQALMTGSATRRVIEVGIEPDDIPLVVDIGQQRTVWLVNATERVFLSRHVKCSYQAAWREIGEVGECPFVA